MTAINMTLRNLYGWVIHGNSLTLEEWTAYRTGFNGTGVIQRVERQAAPEPVREIIDEAVASTKGAVIALLSGYNRELEAVMLKVVSEGGCEQYIEMSVAVSDVSCPLPDSDRKGRRELYKHIEDVSFICMKATITARWKSDEDREKCKVERLKNGRWADVEKYAADILKGDQFPPGLFLHPSLTGRTDGLLEPIDGARRLMAHLEAGKSETPVVVIMRD